MRNTEKYELAFEAFSSKNPEVSSYLKRELLDYAGLSEEELTDGTIIDERACFVMVPTSSLGPFGTACGIVGNRPFTDNLRQKLLAIGADHVAGIVGEASCKFFSLAMPLSSQKRGDMVEELISDNGGSARPDFHEEIRWVLFESE